MTIAFDDKGRAPASTDGFDRDDKRWAAVLTRDRRADGHFYYAVRTTGVYCRPSCGARQPRQENVAYFDSCDTAEQAGFRACKRCRPRGISAAETQVAIVARACRMIEMAETAPSLGALADAACLSPHHFHRMFKTVAGITPKGYADAVRSRRARGALADGASVTEAIYEAGFSSSGRFYEAAPGLLGMKPTRYREGGAGETLRFAIGETSLGSILVVATEKGVASIDFGDNPDRLINDLQERFPRARLIGGDAMFESWVARVVGWVERPEGALDLPLDLRGTAFQQRVWQALRAIPVGRTASYGEIAEKLGMPGASRAVAGACAGNPVALAIPCHRVIRTDGALSGYRWGVDRKRMLLRREGAIRG